MSRIGDCEFKLRGYPFLSLLRDFQRNGNPVTTIRREVEKNGKIKSIFSHIHHWRLMQHLIRDASKLPLANVRSLREILRYPLLIAFIGTMHMQLLIAWLMLGSWGILLYAMIVASPIVVTLHKRETESWKCLNRQ